MIAGEGFHPGLVIGGTLAQDLLADRRDANNLTEEVHHLLGPRQPAEVTVNDNAVEAVIDEREQVAKQQGKWQSPRGPLGVVKPSSVDRASGSSRAGVFGWSMRCAIFSAGPPSMTAASPPSVS